MPWTELSVMDQREEFVRLASAPGANKKALCRRFGISRKTGYKVLRRYAAEGRAGSRRSRSTPCAGARDPASEAALRRAFRKGGWERVRRLHRRSDVPAERCWLRGKAWRLA